MNKHLFVSLMLGASLNAYSYNYLILKQNDGKETAIESNGLKITYDSQNLNAATPSTNLAFPLASLHSMYFSDVLPAGIDDIMTNNSDICIIDKSIYVKAPVGMIVHVADIQGRIVATHTIRTTQFEMVGSNLSNDIYIIKIGNSSTKIQIK